MSEQPLSGPVLSVRDLEVVFEAEQGRVKAVDGVSYDVEAGETVALVGESGCGKSASALAVLGLLPRAGRVTGGEVWLGGRDLLRVTRRELRRVRGKDVAMVFQDPMTSLHPSYTVGSQLVEALRAHREGMSPSAARAEAADLLAMVGLPRDRFGAYPHEWSGGMRQRAMVAMAMANRPKVLIADEPTTALDVTIQAQVLDVLRRAAEHAGAATVLITHDLGVVAELADRAVVMYAGQVVETGSVHDVFAAPRHPYTLGLLGSLPRLEGRTRRLVAIPGQPPDLARPPSGCRFHPRCALRRGRMRCVEEVPAPAPAGFAGVGHRWACHFSDEMPQEVAEVEQELGITIGPRR